MAQKHPAEILGYPIQDRTSIQRALQSGRPCPFVGGPCIKANGICSVRVNDSIVGICPNRLRERNLVMRDISHQHFGTTDNLLVFREVYSGDKAVGSFDFVIAQHQVLSSVIEDFVLVELQTVDTTNTGRLNQALSDFDSGLAVQERTYGFGLNWANVWKRCFIQILNKGRVTEAWGHKTCWIVQEPTYQYLLDAYGLGSAVKPGTGGSTVFMVYDLIDSHSSVRLRPARIESAAVEELLLAFGANAQVPSLDRFLD